VSSGHEIVFEKKLSSRDEEKYRSKKEKISCLLNGKFNTTRHLIDLLQNSPNNKHQIAFVEELLKKYDKALALLGIVNH
jgi:hypothetical protein